MIFLVLSLTICSVLAEEIERAVPVNFKSKCEPGFIGEKFCENNQVHQYYQNNVCFKYDKILATCSTEEVCKNAECVASMSGNGITGEAVKQVENENKGFFSRIIDWFKNLF